MFGEDFLPDVKPYDTTLELRQIVGFFGRRSKAYQSELGNKYILSYGNDFLCIVHSRQSKYRIIGRSEKLQPVQNTVHYDVFFSGTLSECIVRFKCLVPILLS